MAYELWVAARLKVSPASEIFGGAEGQLPENNNNLNLWTSSRQNGTAQKGWVLVERKEVQ